MQDITLDAQIHVHRNYFCPFFVVLCHQIEQRNELIWLQSNPLYRHSLNTDTRV